MPLAVAIVERIRDEIGPDLDVSDEATSPPAPLGDLETIYIDTDRGNESTLRTAYIVWKRRLGAIQARSFDATASGSLMARSQRARFIQRRIKELELLVDFTLVSINQTVKSNFQGNDDDAPEF